MFSITLDVDHHSNTVQEEPPVEEWKGGETQLDLVVDKGTVLTVVK